MTNKLKYFIGNWKMFGDFKDFKIVNKVNQFSYSPRYRSKKKKIILCVPNVLLDNFNKKIGYKHISFGAQNCHHHQGSGPFTGSVNASMLKSSGAEYIILGHSENRSEGESYSIIKKKIISSLEKKFIVIFCIGESLTDKRAKKTYSVLRQQIKGSLDKKFDINKIIIAYEPVWSIGTNKIPKTHELIKNVKFIKKEYKKIFKTKIDPKVLYGGSVNNKNIGLFSQIDELDGFLIGSASQSSKKFIDIVKNYYK